jgi:hypothetical protein
MHPDPDVRQHRGLERVPGHRQSHRRIHRLEGRAIRREAQVDSALAPLFVRRHEGQRRFHEHVARAVVGVDDGRVVVGIPLDPLRALQPDAPVRLGSEELREVRSSHADRAAG